MTVEILILQILSVALLATEMTLWRSRVLTTEPALLAVVLTLHAIAAYAASSTGGILINSGSATFFALTAHETEVVGGMFLSASFVCATFATVIAAVFGTRRLSKARPLREQASVYGHLFASVASSPATTVIVVVGLIFAISLWAIHFQSFMSRSQYFSLDAGSIGSAFSYLTLPIGAAMFIALHPAAGRSRRAFAGIVLTLLILAEFSRASRGLPALLALLTISMALTARRRPMRVALLIATPVLAVLTLSLVIQLRGNSSGHGLIPYSAYVFGSYHFDSQDLSVVANNLLLSLAVTYFSALQAVPSGFFAVSITPLNGVDAGWYLMAPYLSLGYQTPSNAIGQMASASTAEWLFWWASISLLLTIPGLLRLRLPITHAIIAELAGVTLIAAATLQLLQYSLRAGARFIWAAIAVSLAVVVISKVRANPERAPAQPIPSQPIGRSS